VRTGVKVTFFILLFFGLCFRAFGFEVVVSNSPLKKLVKEVFPQVKVVQILPSGADFHSYEPSFSQWLKVKKADLVVIVGTEPWAKRVFAMRRSKPVLALSKEDRVKDPHLWFDLTRVRHLVLALKTFLEKKFPSKKREIENRCKRFLAKLSQVKREYESLAKCKGKVIFVAGHPVFDYLLKLARKKEVTLVKGYEEEEEPSVRDFLTFLKGAKKQGNGIVFLADPRFERYLSRFKACGLKTFKLWTGAGYVMKGSYIYLLEYNLKTMKKALCKVK